MSTIDGTDGDDTLFGTDDQDVIRGYGGRDTMYAGDGNDWCEGAEGADRIHGGAGADTLDGGAGRDRLSGGTGNDLFLVHAASDIGNGELYDGGSGIDTLSLGYPGGNLTAATLVGIENLDAGNGDVTLTAEQLLSFSTVNADVLELTTGGEIDLSAVDTTDMHIELAAVDNHVTLSTTAVSWGVSVFGNDGRDVVSGTAFGDWLDGGRNNDTLTGGDGNDILTGGPGVDALYGGNGDDAIRLMRGDDLDGAAQVSGGDGVDELLLFPSFQKWDLSGIDLHDFEKITGGSPDITVTADQLNGLLKLDVYHVFVTNAGAIDLSQCDVFVSGIHLSAAGNTIIMPSDDDLANNFAVIGSTGDDNISGGADYDVFFHGSGGDDTISFSAIGNGHMYGGSGDDALTGGQSLAVDTIQGDTGDDLIHASLGADALDGGKGIDTVTFDAIGGAVTVNLAHGSTNGAIKQTIAGVEHVIGTAFGDILTGADTNDTLEGADGDDVLAGGLGADVIDGGAGADTVAIKAKDSVGKTYDTVAGFDAQADHFDVPAAVGAIDATIGTGDLSYPSLLNDMIAAVGAGALGAHHAVLFTPDSGGLAGATFLIVDVDGTAGYGIHDLVIRLDAPVNIGDLDVGDFI